MIVLCLMYMYSTKSPQTHMYTVDGSLLELLYTICKYIYMYIPKMRTPPSIKTLYAEVLPYVHVYMCLTSYRWFLQAVAVLFVRLSSEGRLSEVTTC